MEDFYSSNPIGKLDQPSRKGKQTRQNSKTNKQTKKLFQGTGELKKLREICKAFRGAFISELSTDNGTAS